MLWIFCACAVVLLVYITIYLFYYGKQPEIYCKKNTELHKLIQKHLKRVKSSYWPLFWCYESRAIFISRHYISPHTGQVKYRQEVCKTEDGGCFIIDWAGSENIHNGTIIVFVPGITCDRNTSYVCSVIFQLLKAGHVVALVNHRGVGITEKEPTPAMYCATHTVDLHKAVSMIKERHKDATIIGIGASLGGMMMAKYLEETGEDCDLTAAVLFSCPFHPLVNCKRIAQPLNSFLIDRPIGEILKQNYSIHKDLFKHQVDHDAVMESRGIKEFDEAFTAPVFGYNSSDHYYEQCTVGKERLKAIRRPTLCVNADDDVFSEEATLPKTDIVKTEHVAMVMTKGGGHVSHMQGLNPFGQTFFEEVLLEYIDAFTTHFD